MKSLRCDRSGVRPGPADARDRRPTGRVRGDLRRAIGRDLGFSLVELMVVLSVVTLLAVAAAAGFRRNEFSTQYARFVADVEGVVVLARNTAIDRQTQVRVEVTSVRVGVTRYDSTTNTWEPVHAAEIAAPNAALIGAASAVCIYGFTAGVQTPKQAAVVTPPADCVGGSQTVVFEPDGRMTDPNNIFDAMPNSGATLWLADRTLASAPRYTIIQIFPGGLVRKFEDME